MTNRGQLNQPIGQHVADQIAAQLGLNKADTFTKKQFLEFVTGQGVGGNLADASWSTKAFESLPTRSDVRCIPSSTVTCTIGPGQLWAVRQHERFTREPGQHRRPDETSKLVIAPGGYLGTWCKANGATASLVTLYKSAYRLEAVYGDASQQISGVAQLVTNTRGGVSSEVGMSMAPSIWLVNFALLYTLNPALAADMPANWAPIPSTVADAILAGPTGQVPYSKYASALR